ncbi:MAG TPA: restriction endonuclease subunit R, partial [Leptospiraceae bacterium]|nr:restriction endonuclease subunit R [Leptospiraceae bacterium]
MHSRSWREEYVSQIPALQVLIQLGYEYLPPEEALSLRGGKTNRVLLESVLEGQLRKLNSIQFKGKEYEFSDSNIQDAIRDLRDIPLTGGLVSSSEVAYDLLTLGVSKEQTIDGDRKSFSMKYIDWENPENNVYHVTDEFEVEKVKSHELRRPDIVLFVNGIPLVIIECKKPTSGLEGESSVWEAVSQHLRNQRSDEIPNLFIYSQLLLSINKNEALYATTDTPRKFWAVWKEENLNESELKKCINTTESDEQKARLLDHREPAVRKHFEELRAGGDRLPTEQDRTLYSLLTPSRLLELIFQYIVYDAGVKKITRYQQYFAIQATLERVRNLGSDRRRRGGVIWHTTGSGKSLTMVMLAKSLALEPSIKNPKVILVTDRVDLDTQIWRTFKACGKTPVQADSGRHLVELLKKSDDAIITTVIDKFEQAASTKGHINEDSNTFVLVDESHRSQYGSMNAKMEKVFPNACYIGFTGTPLLKTEKSTSAKFGGIIHKYSINQAVKDGAVVPLLYEGRLAVTDVNKKAIDQ